LLDHLSYTIIILPLTERSLGFSCCQELLLQFSVFLNSQILYLVWATNRLYGFATHTFGIRPSGNDPCRLSFVPLALKELPQAMLLIPYAVF
jgi:hypothetical protein